MSRPRTVSRTLAAATAALLVASSGAAALPAMADPGKGQSQHAQDKGKDKDDKKDDQKDKGDNGHGPKGDQGPKGNNGHGPKDGQGPKGNNGHGPKDGQGPKGDQGNGDPAGNNGTVKITPIGQDDGIPQNNPHVPCGFDIEWYGFDEGEDIISQVTLAMHAPTKDVALTPGGPSEVFVGGDPATGAGTDTGFDGEATYYPTFEGEPHPKQGYHVKLTVHTPGSQGADTKHKVFWVEPCEDAPEEGTTPEDEVNGEETDETEENEENEETEVLGEQVSAEKDGDDTEVLGEQAVVAADESSTDVPNAVDAGDEGNPVVDFVTSPVPLALLVLGGLLAGVALVARRRTS